MVSLIQEFALRELKVETIIGDSNEGFNLKNELEFSQDLFVKSQKMGIGAMVVRPSLSYWQDAIHRFMKNKQALFAFGLAVILVSFAYIGPFIWRKDPTVQDLNGVSMPPNMGELAVVVADESPVFEPTIMQLEIAGEQSFAEVAPPLGAVNSFKVDGIATTQRVILQWEHLAGAAGYTIYRNEVEPGADSLGVPMGEINDGLQINFEDTQSLEARDYYYVIVAKDINGSESTNNKILKVKVLSAISETAANELGVKSKLGNRVRLSAAPLGTDSLGRDILARLMSGGRVSLFIGVVASLLSVFFGIFLGGVSGFFGGRIDTILMRFTDLITGLPFLLFMILLKVILNVGPGESGVVALLISLVVLSWTGTARLVRGQILQLRNSEFVQAARMMGAKPGYLLVRHMMPNLIGVILVTLTFQIPSAIFTEAFLSFIGLGVAAPETSWGSMCNDAIQSLLTRPYEFFAPAIVISLTVLSFNLLGDGLRDALDPKLRSNE
jgi:oligopeptide transport system permease protein